MTVDLVHSIRNAEKKADELVRLAGQQARRAVKSARAKAVAATEKQLAAGEQRAAELISRAEQEAQAEAEPLREASRDEIALLGERAAARMSRAVALVKERIVSWP